MADVRIVIETTDPVELAAELVTATAGYPAGLTVQYVPTGVVLVPDGQGVVGGAGVGSAARGPVPSPAKARPPATGRRHVEREARKPAAPPDRIRPETVERLKAVAAVWHEATAEGRPAARAVAEAAGISEGAARQRIIKARKAGLIPPSESRSGGSNQTEAAMARWQVAADAYLAAVEAGEPTTEAVMAACGCSAHAATQMVANARKRGLLPPSTRKGPAPRRSRPERPTIVRPAPEPAPEGPKPSFPEAGPIGHLDVDHDAARAAAADGIQ